MNLHRDLMNLQCDPDPTLSVRADVGYKMGHRDARHAAAELSLKYERYIELLENHLEDVDDLLFDLRKEAGL